MTTARVAPRADVETVYDKAAWHRDGAYPSDLPPTCALIPAGMFFGWAIHRELVSDTVRLSLVDDVRARRITGAVALGRLDGVLSADLLAPEARRFADGYYRRSYLADYARTVAAGCPTAYHAPDSWDRFELVVTMLDERYLETSAAFPPPSSTSDRLDRLERIPVPEVAAVLAFARLADPTAVPRLRALKADRGWDHWGVEGNRRVPLGRWIDVVCDHLEGGIERVIERAREPVHLSFAVALLQEVGGPAGEAAIERIAEGTSDPAARARCAAALALLRRAPT